MHSSAYSTISKKKKIPWILPDIKPGNFNILFNSNTTYLWSYFDFKDEEAITRDVT